MAHNFKKDDVYMLHIRQNIFTPNQYKAFGQWLDTEHAYPFWDWYKQYCERECIENDQMSYQSDCYVTSDTVINANPYYYAPVPKDWVAKVNDDYERCRADGCDVLKACYITAEYNGATFNIQLGIPTFTYVGGQIYTL